MKLKELLELQKEYHRRKIDAWRTTLLFEIAIDLKELKNELHQLILKEMKKDAS